MPTGSKPEPSELASEELATSGIPPEAREAARAAARREGLSVGEWMTRRILRSFSETSDDVTPAREQGSSNRGHAPQPEPRSPSRRDTEEMLVQAARKESESNDVYRRIEEQLRSVARRLESAERNQSENNRAMSKAAAEINLAAREQAQAFDQLGSSVMSLADRLERVERNAVSDGLPSQKIPPLVASAATASLVAFALMFVASLPSNFLGVFLSPYRDGLLVASLCVALAGLSVGAWQLFRKDTV